MLFPKSNCLTACENYLSYSAWDVPRRRPPKKKMKDSPTGGRRNRGEKGRERGRILIVNYPIFNPRYPPLQPVVALNLLG